MAECDDVKFRIQMKREGRIFTGVGEGLESSLSGLLTEVRVRGEAGDMDALMLQINRLREAAAKINEELGELIDFVDLLRDAVSGEDPE